MKTVIVYELGKDGKDHVAGRLVLRDGKVVAEPNSPELTALASKPIIVPISPDSDPDQFMDKVHLKYSNSYLRMSKAQEFPDFTENTFCATGKGGGVDPSCSPGKSGGSPSGPSQPIGRYDYPAIAKAMTSGEEQELEEKLEEKRVEALKEAENDFIVGDQYTEKDVLADAGIDEHSIAKDFKTLVSRHFTDKDQIDALKEKIDKWAATHDVAEEMVDDIRVKGHADRMIDVGLNSIKKELGTLPPMMETAISEYRKQLIDDYDKSNEAIMDHKLEEFREKFIEDYDNHNHIKNRRDLLKEFYDEHKDERRFAGKPKPWHASGQGIADYVKAHPLAGNAKQFTPLELKKIAALNPDGIKNGVCYVPRMVSGTRGKGANAQADYQAAKAAQDAKIEHLKTILPAGTKIKVKVISAKKLFGADVDSPDKQYAEEKKVMSTHQVVDTHQLQGGINGSYTINFKNDGRAVFKPLSEEYADGGGPRPGKVPERTSYKREVAASIIAEYGGFSDLVPPTVLVNHPTKGIGSAQKFAENSRNAQAVYGSERFDGDKDLARAAAFDYLVGHSDRHEKNWMVQHNPADPRGYGKLVLIDNGLCLPVEEGGFANWEFVREAQGRRLRSTPLTIPELPEVNRNWDTIARKLKDIGIEDEAISLMKTRLGRLRGKAGKGFDTLPDIFNKVRNDNPASW